jgi:thiamine pyrophosphokinase
MISHPIEAGTPFTALVLNYYLPPFLRQLWGLAKTRICADGGANRLTAFFGDAPFHAPDFVVGDFDSIRPAVRAGLERRGTRFELIDNQDYNDLHKCLAVLAERAIRDPVVVFGAVGGRLDQTIASFSVGLARADMRVFFLDENNFSTWVLPGDKGVAAPQRWTTRICGLLPIARPVRRVRTVGLRWDCDFGLDMAGMISSSNEISEGVTSVVIETTDPILWTNQTRRLEQLPLS